MSIGRVNACERGGLVVWNGTVHSGIANVKEVLCFMHEAKPRFVVVEPTSPDTLRKSVEAHPDIHVIIRDPRITTLPEAGNSFTVNTATAALARVEAAPTRMPPAANAAGVPAKCAPSS